jgi:excisionase family DNA binding protein
MSHQSKRDALRELDEIEGLEGLDDEGNILDAEDFKDYLFNAWLEKATRTLRRLPEYRWLFSETTPDWFTTEQVAERMGVSKKTVYGWAKHIIGARPAEGKAGYRMPRSGLVIFLADSQEDEPTVAMAEEFFAKAEDSAAHGDERRPTRRGLTALRAQAPQPEVPDPSEDEE